MALPHIFKDLFDAAKASPIPSKGIDHPLRVAAMRWNPMGIRKNICCLLILSLIKSFPSDLISGTVPVKELIGLQLIFGHIGIIPPRHEILVKGNIKATEILVVFKDIFGHPLDILACMVMLDPDVVIQNGQF